MEATMTGSALNAAKMTLADEATSLLHGRSHLPAIHETAKSMFGGAGTTDTSQLPKFSAPRGTRVIDALVGLGFASSKKEAKRLIAGGGCRVRDEKVVDELAELDGDEAELVLRAGKKKAGLVVFE
jgi:tyrosyl-tRNA synthetase